MNQPLRILHVLNGLNIGGMEMFIMNYYRNIDKSRVQFDFAIFDKSKNHFESEVKNLGGNVYFIDSKKSTNKYLQCVHDALAFYSFLKKNNYSIVHCHGCSFLNILQGSIGAKLAKTKIVIAHAHSASLENGGVMDKCARAVMKNIIKWSCNVYYACSRTAALSKYTSSLINKNRIVYINNAVELSKFKFNNEVRENLRKQLNIPSSSLVVGIVGRLEFEKNHMYLLDVFRSVQSAKDDSYLLIIGSGSLRGKIESYAKELELKNVIFTGNVNNPYDYYQVMDCFVLPSFYEGFPFVLVESQASGLPCFVSDTVTKEVCLLPETKMLSIKANPIEWQKEILNTATIDRVSSYRIVQDKGFDLKNESERLCNLYYEYITK